MKKIIFIITMMCACLTINAQVWDTVADKTNDEFGTLLGTMSYCGHAIEGVNEQYLFIFEYIDHDFIVSSNRYDFDDCYDFDGTHRTGDSGGKLIKGRVEFYNEAGERLKMIDDYCFEKLQKNGKGYKLHSNRYTQDGKDNRENAREIYRYLRNEKGYLYFIIPLIDEPKYGMLMLKVSCLK